jgi:hypothetical protein
MIGAIRSSVTKKESNPPLEKVDKMPEKKIHKRINLSIPFLP